jgi:hypothetical protein
MKCDIGNQLFKALEAATVKRIEIDQTSFILSREPEDARDIKARAKRAFDESLERSWGHGMARPKCRNS